MFSKWDKTVKNSVNEILLNPFFRSVCFYKMWYMTVETLDFIMVQSLWCCLATWVWDTVWCLSHTHTHTHVSYVFHDRKGFLTFSVWSCDLHKCSVTLHEQYSDFNALTVWHTVLFSGLFCISDRDDTLRIMSYITLKGFILL